jgi:cytochrome P450
MVTAGTDVASVGLYGIFNLMCNYPEVQEEVADEIDRFVKLNGHIPDFTEREQVPYCISVIKECLRFKPIQAFGLPHVTQKDSKYIKNVLNILAFVMFI